MTVKLTPHGVSASSVALFFHLFFNLPQTSCLWSSIQTEQEVITDSMLDGTRGTWSSKQLIVLQVRLKKIARFGKLTVEAQESVHMKKRCLWYEVCHPRQVSQGVTRRGQGGGGWGVGCLFTRVPWTGLDILRMPKTGRDESWLGWQWNKPSVKDGTGERLTLVPKRRRLHVKRSFVELTLTKVNWRFATVKSRAFGYVIGNHQLPAVEVQFRWQK